MTSPLLRYPGLNAPGDDTANLYNMRNHGGIHRISELVDFIKYASKHYYEGSPKVPNSAFDEAIGLLRLNDPDHPLLSTPGWGYTPDTSGDGYWEAFQHDPEMRSITLDNRYQAAVNFVVRTPLLTDTFTVMPKFDGGSARAYYKDGVLQALVTRGDGKTGLDIKDNFILNNSPPRTINDKDLEYVDGDILVSWTDFKVIGGTSPRDVAVTMSEAEINHLDYESCLVFMAYGTDRGYEQGKDLDHLRQLGFHASPYQLYFDWEDFLKFAENKDQLTKFFDDYPIDGLILRTKDRTIAFKFEDERSK